MGFLVDGSNLGGVLGGRAGARNAEEVVRYLLTWARTRRQEVVVVFDGAGVPGRASTFGALTVVWSGPVPADERIVERVAAEPARWTVVTADRELASRCRGAGARTLPASELVATLARREQQPAPARGRPGRSEPSDKPPTHAEEREHWKRVFDPESN